MLCKAILDGQGQHLFRDLDVLEIYVCRASSDKDKSGYALGLICPLALPVSREPEAPISSDHD